jgi:peptidoglycan/LPS O-acetylase OafA/YrhL
MPTPKPKSGYIPSLDGWRTLAILAVIMTHDQPWTIAGFSNAAWKGYGTWGVYLFFAISGYLICTRILEDEARLGTFRLKAFYIRRVFRIQPAAWAYLSVVAILIAAGVDHDAWKSWFGALFLYTNFLYRSFDGSSAGYLTTHFWTLAVEEHFYILLSLLLFFVKRGRMLAFSLFFLATYLIKHWIYVSGRYNDSVMMRQTQMMLGFMVFPACIALFLRNQRVMQFAVRYLRPWVAYLATPLVMLMWGLRSYGLHGMLYPLHHPVDTENTVIFGFTFWVVATALHPRSWSTRLLETAPMRFVGRLSYSIYLWHMLFFTAYLPEAGIHWPPLLWLSERPYRYLAAAACALSSYYLVERPLIRMGHRLAPPATPGHADLDGSAPPVVSDELPDSVRTQPAS